MDKGYNQPGAWAVIYCATTGKFLMGKRSAKVNKAGAWNLFGGRVDNGERPRQALVRELGEEAGLNIKPQHLAKLRTVSRRLRSGQAERDMHYYVVKAEREFSPRLNRETATSAGSPPSNSRPDSTCRQRWPSSRACSGKRPATERLE